jgi:glyoxylase-like metal-dependent hydrolase (beta-lactamase superfamily II)
MNAEVYPFKVGDLQCMAVSDGTYIYGPPRFPPPASFLFANARRDALDKALGEHGIRPEQWTAWVSPYICLIVKTGKHTVLVDTGADGLDSTTGRLLRNLQTRGIRPEDIDTVIITHAHPDHTGGNIDTEGKPAFPGARYVMWKEEWNFWTSKEAESKLGEHGAILLAFAHKNLPPIESQLDLINHEGEILPGIRAVAAPGHSPGQMALAISSKGEQLLCISDVVLHPIHVEQPEWCATADFAPEQVVTIRRRLLSRAAVEKALVIAFHFPFPGLGHVVQEGKGWRWQPVARAG